MYIFNRDFRCARARVCVCDSDFMYIKKKPSQKKFNVFTRKIYGLWLLCVEEMIKGIDNLIKMHNLLIIWDVYEFVIFYFFYVFLLNNFPTKTNLLLTLCLVGILVELNLFYCRFSCIMEKLSTRISKDIFIRSTL